MNGRIHGRSVRIFGAAVGLALGAAVALFASGSVLGVVPLVLAVTALAGLIRARRAAARAGRAGSGPGWS